MEDNYNKAKLRCKKKQSKKKAAKGPKALRPSLGSLQHTIVLAPFHTLKKCFQTKLIDLYSQEKMKKINHKMKMAKRPNASFEYDVIELKPLAQKTAKKVQRKKDIDKRKRSRSASYCKCDRNETKPASQYTPVKAWKQRTRISIREPPKTDSPPQNAKRPRLSNQSFVPSILKCDLGPKTNNLLARQSDISLSVPDSSETFSDSLSCREERLEGSLAVSTTSFDSSLGHFGEDSRLNTQLNALKRNPDLPAGPVLKPQDNQSRHLILNVEIKNSDGRIVDFMDREPQTQTIPNGETSHHLRPLRRQSRSKSNTRTKTKKRDPKDANVSAYYLRSADEQAPISPSNTGSRVSQNYCRESVVSVHVGTQVEENTNQDYSVLKTPVAPPEAADVIETPPPHAEEPSCEILHQRKSSEQVQAQSPESTEASGDVWRVEDVQTCALVDVPELGAPRVGQSQQPQDKELDFIFGNRNSESRLNESCEFSFGLKWVFSDDEDSNHDDRLF